MYLKFNTLRKVDLNLEEATKRIDVFFENSDYVKTNQSKAEKIGFKYNDNGFKPTSFSVYYKIIDYGRFDLSDIKSQAEINLNFSISVTFEFFQLLIIGLLMFTEGLEVGFLSLVIILNFCFKVYNIKKNFMNNIFPIIEK